MSDNIMPPRKRDWTQGRAQVGVFIRTEDGHIVQIVNNDCAPERALHLQAFMLTELKVKLSCARCGKSLTEHAPGELAACVREVGGTP